MLSILKKKKSNAIELHDRTLKSVFNMHHLFRESQEQDLSGFFYFTESNKISQTSISSSTPNHLFIPLRPSFRILKEQEAEPFTPGRSKLASGLWSLCVASEMWGDLTQGSLAPLLVVSTPTSPNSAVRISSGALIPETAELGAQSVSILTSDHVCVFALR